VANVDPRGQSLFQGPQNFTQNGIFLSENKPSGKPASKPACRGLFSQLGLSLLNFNRKSKIGKSLLNETRVHFIKRNSAKKSALNWK
jgi:hypothetical protein